MLVKRKEKERKRVLVSNNNNKMLNDSHSTLLNSSSSTLHLMHVSRHDAREAVPGAASGDADDRPLLPGEHVAPR